MPFFTRRTGTAFVLSCSLSVLAVSCSGSATDKRDTDSSTSVAGTANREVKQDSELNEITNGRRIESATFRDSEKTVNAGRNAAMTLKIHESAREEGLSVEIEVTNTGKERFVWDREFSALVEWHVFLPDGTELNPTTIGRPKDAARDDRFVTLNSGQSLKRTIKLSDAICRIHSSSAVTDDGDVGSGYEELTRFDVPEGARELRVVVQYSCVDTATMSGFYFCFGINPEAAGFPGLFVEDSIIVKLGDNKASAHKWVRSTIWRESSPVDISR